MLLGVLLRLAHLDVGARVGRRNVMHLGLLESISMLHKMITGGFGNRKLLARSINVPSKRSKDLSNYEALIARNRLLKMAIS